MSYQIKSRIMQNLKLKIRRYNSKDRDIVIQLWDECGSRVPWNHPAHDIARKMNTTSPDLFFAGLIAHKPVATVMAGHEGHRGWINFVAVSPKHRRCGFGKQMIEFAEATLRKNGCPKINLPARENNQDVIRFCQAIGYKDNHVIS